MVVKRLMNEEPYSSTIALAVLRCHANRKGLLSGKGSHTIDLVIFAGFDFREFVILGFYTKSRIRELSNEATNMTYQA